MCMHAHLNKYCSVLGLSHPALFQIFKPVVTTGDGSCLFHALPLTLTGTETCSDLLRLLVVHALVKHTIFMWRINSEFLGGSEALFLSWHTLNSIPELEPQCIKLILNFVLLLTCLNFLLPPHLFLSCLLLNNLWIEITLKIITINPSKYQYHRTMRIGQAPFKHFPFLSSTSISTFSNLLLLNLFNALKPESYYSFCAPEMKKKKKLEN